MSIFKVSPTDLLRSKTVQPGWWTVLIKNVQQKPAGAGAKNPGSINTVVTAVIVGGPYDGVPIDTYFSEVAPGMAVNFIAAITGKPIRTPEDLNSEGYDFDLAKGKKVKAEVINDTYKGALTNKIKDWQPLV
jgi:hypothetical protein